MPVLGPEPPRLPTVSVDVPAGEVEGMPLGAIVVVTVRGKITSAREEGPGMVCIVVEGSSSVRPGTLNDAAVLAVARVSNAAEPPDLSQSGMYELHAP